MRAKTNSLSNVLQEITIIEINMIKVVTFDGLILRYRFRPKNAIILTVYSIYPIPLGNFKNSIYFCNFFQNSNPILTNKVWKIQHIASSMITTR